MKDLTGNRYGRLVAIDQGVDKYRPSGRRVITWNCKCDCGSLVTVESASLSSNRSKSCGCIKPGKKPFNRDLSGSSFGLWYVLSKADSKWNSDRLVKYWKCICECGTERNVREESLLRNKSMSCGCSRSVGFRYEQFDDLSNLRFGKWTVIKRTDDRFYPKGGRAQMWKCVCDCGSIKTVAGNMLKSGISQSCGCNSISVCESHVKNYLDKFEIDYTLHKKFNDLHGVGGGLLSYDFYIPDFNCLIECQGLQHYKPVDYFGGVERFNIQREHDSRKRAYSEKLGIKLIEIPYKVRTQEDIYNLLNDVLSTDEE